MDRLLEAQWELCWAGELSQASRGRTLPLRETSSPSVPIGMAPGRAFLALARGPLNRVHRLQPQHRLGTQTLCAQRPALPRRPRDRLWCDRSSVVIKSVPGNRFLLSFAFSSSVAWAAAFTWAGPQGRVAVSVTFYFICWQVWGFLCDPLLVQVFSPLHLSQHRLYIETVNSCYKTSYLSGAPVDPLPVACLGRWACFPPTCLFSYLRLFINGWTNVPSAIA